ncbi:MAG: calcium/sodium antiporter [Clostridia bacterium]|nr:calcium/sodium antiporter [Clostridia bacterium]
MFEQLFAWYNGLTDSLWGSLLLFVVGVLLLIKGGDWFVDSAVGVAKRFRVPEIIIGATVVSIGTTLPEVMVSVTAALNDNGAIAYGNAIGSIICNTALIAALTIAIRPAPVERKTLVTPVLFFFASAAIYLVAAYIFGRFDRWLGIVMLVVFAIYMTMTIRKGFKNPVQAQAEEEEAHSGSLLKDLIVLVVSAALIAVGADMLEGSSVSLATMAGIPTEVIGVTVVALCTSLPELVTAVTALAKGHGALSLGNIIGANIFNLVLVSGAAVTLSPFVIPEGSKLFGFNTSQLVEIPLMVGVMALMTLPTLAKGKLRRWQGVALLGIYAAFVALQVLIALGVF